MTVPPAEAIGRKPNLVDKTPIRKPDSIGTRLVHKAAEFAINHVLSHVLFTAVSDNHAPTPQAKEPRSTDQTDAAHTRIILFQRDRRPKRRRRSPFRRTSTQPPLHVK